MLAVKTSRGAQAFYAKPGVLKTARTSVPNRAIALPFLGRSERSGDLEGEADIAIRGKAVKAAGLKAE